ncbi:MAG: hypothetical protein ACLUTA_16325 [Blautia wexlerae]
MRCFRIEEEETDDIVEQTGRSMEAAVSYCDKLLKKPLPSVMRMQEIRTAVF